MRKYAQCKVEFMGEGQMKRFKGTVNALKKQYKD
jgi:hypothetical protein